MHPLFFILIARLLFAIPRWIREQWQDHKSWRDKCDEHNHDVFGRCYTRDPATGFIIDPKTRQTIEVDTRFSPFIDPATRRKNEAKTMREIERDKKRYGVPSK